MRTTRPGLTNGYVVANMPQADTRVVNQSPLARRLIILHTLSATSALLSLTVILLMLSTAYNNKAAQRWMSLTERIGESETGKPRLTWSRTVDSSSPARRSSRGSKMTACADPPTSCR